jgi:hypothetical protein
VDSKWGTFWTAVGSIAAVVSVALVIWPPGSSSSGVEGATPSAQPVGQPEAATTEGPASPGDSDGISVTIARMDGSSATVFSLPSQYSEAVGRIPNGTRVRVRCAMAGEYLFDNAQPSANWINVGNGYISAASIRDSGALLTAPQCPPIR